MSYGADFPAADPAGAPLDAPILIGADPALWGALILLLLAAGLLGWFLRGQSAPKTGDASEAIWKAVNGAAKDAMTADDNALKGKAEHLAKVIRSRLGGVLAIAGGKGGLVAGLGALDKAIAGKHPDKKDEPHKPAHDGHGKGHDDKAADHDHKPDAHGHAPAQPPRRPRRTSSSTSRPRLRPSPKSRTTVDIRRNRPPRPRT